jgi:hypothetical protein
MKLALLALAACSGAPPEPGTPAPQETGQAPETGEPPCEEPSDPPETPPSTPGAANLAACERYLDGFACCDPAEVAELAQTDCEAFLDDCDISAYFECLAEGYDCDDQGALVADPAELQTCSDLAVCP